MRVDNIELETWYRNVPSQQPRSSRAENRRTKPELSADDSIQQSRSKKTETEDVTPTKRTRFLAVVGLRFEEGDQALEKEGGEVAVGSNWSAN